MNLFDSNLIELASLIISFFAMLTGIYAVVESRKSRIQCKRISENQQQYNITINNVNKLRKAYKNFCDLPKYDDHNAIEFNKYVNVIHAINNDLWFLSSTEKQIWESEMENIQTRFNKVSGINLKMPNSNHDLSTTCALYDDYKFPEDLSLMYTKIKDLLSAQLEKEKEHLEKIQMFLK